MSKEKEAVQLVPADQIEKLPGAREIENYHEPEHPKPVNIRNAFDIQPRSFAAGLKRRGENRQALMDWLEEALDEGVDYGKLHVVNRDKCPKPWECTNPYHYSKPSLFKPGAEKIAGMMGFRSAWPNLDAVMDRLQEGGNIIILKCQLVDSSGAIASEGVGARDLRKDDGDINKALKMAKKSGLIDAVLNAGGLSEAFTQDIEDMPPGALGEHADPYSSGEDRAANVSFPSSNAKPVATHCPIGKEWKGQPWAAVDDGFLNWILGNIDDKPDLLHAAKKELEGRSLDSQEKATTRRDDAILHTKSLGEYVREIGNATKLDQITAIRDELPDEFLPSVRAFLAKRTVELQS